MFGYHPFHSARTSQPSFSDIFTNQYYPTNRRYHYDDDDEQEQYRKHYQKQMARQHEEQRQQELRRRQQQELYKQELLRQQQEELYRQQQEELYKQELLRRNNAHKHQQFRKRQPTKHTRPIDYNTSALKIQKTFRGYLIRKQNIISKLRAIKKVEDEVDQIVQHDTSIIGLPQDASVPLPENTQYVGGVPKQFLAFELALTSKLILLDEISCGSSEVARSARKAVASKIEQILAYVDVLKKAYRHEENIVDASINQEAMQQDHATVGSELFEEGAATPQTVDAIPETVDSSQSLNDVISQTIDVAPGNINVTPQADDTTPLINDITPQTDDTTPLIKDITPQADDTTPLINDITPQDIDVIPQVTDVTTQDVDVPVAPQSIDTPQLIDTPVPPTSLVDTPVSLASEDNRHVREIPTLKCMCYNLCDQLMKKALYVH